MWLIASAKTFLGWAFSVYRKILRIAPGPVALVVCATLVSQMSRLAAFFLPLKIVILVGGSGVPRYFPGFLQDMGKEALVVWLGVVTVLAYLLHRLADRAVTFWAERSADRLLERADKLVMFANQDGVARNACQKLAESLAAFIFALIALALIAMLHASMAIFLAIWIAAAFILTAAAGASSAGFRVWLEDNAAGFLNGVTQSGFFAATGLIVAEFIAGARFNVLYAIIGLLLAREALQQVGRLVNNALALNPLKVLINALFFHDHTWPGAAAPQRKDIWQWMAPGRLVQWLPAILRDATGRPAQNPVMERWHQTGMTDLFVFGARVETGDGEQRRYFVKLFASSRGVWASHEATLLEAVPAGSLPAPPLLGIGKVDGFSCHVFGEADWRPIAPDELAEAQNAMRGACLACRLPEGLVTRFRRSHQLLDSRLLTAAKIERLVLVADDGERHLVERLASSVQPLSAFLRGLPLALHNPDLLSAPPLMLENGQAVASQWSRWTLEPIGGGWPVQVQEFRQIRKWLSAARQKRPDLKDVTGEQVQLAALLFAFEKFLVGERYSSAIAMLPRIFSKAEDAGVLAAAEEINSAASAADLAAS